MTTLRLVVEPAFQQRKTGGLGRPRPRYEKAPLCDLWHLTSGAGTPQATAFRWRGRWVACALLLAACTRAPAPQAAPAPTKTGELSVDLAIEPNPPSTGDNKLLVTVRDGSGAPVDNAQLAFVYDMPAMGAMPEMKGNGESQAEGGGRYTVTYPLSMNGDWMLTLDVKAAGHPPKTVRLKVAPPRKGFVLENENAALGSAPGVDVSTRRQQLIGLTFTTVEERSLTIPVRAAGRVAVDERQLAEVTLKYDAYVQKLFVAETGRTVHAGEPLLQLYSPDLLAAEEELLQARRHSSGEADPVLKAARRKLRLWDLSEAQIADLEKKDRGDGTTIIRAPIAGAVLEKTVVAGTRVMTGTTIYRLGFLGRIWLEADFHEADAALVRLGAPATIVLPSQPGVPLKARISFVSPMVDERTRTLRARLELPNARLALKPGMFADVRLEIPVGNRLSVPDRALLLSGEHRYAFVERSAGHLEPVEVQIGAMAGDYDEVVSGLEDGDKVVLSPAFLISSEAQLRGVLPQWGPK